MNNCNGYVTLFVPRSAALQTEFYCARPKNGQRAVISFATAVQRTASRFPMP